MANHLFRPLCIFIFSMALALPTALPGGEPERRTPPDSGKKDHWIAGWKSTEPMLAVRTGAAIYYSAQHIYMIGGLGLEETPHRPGKKRRPAYLKTSEYARINPDGSLSAWQPGPSLNTERGYFSVVRHGNHLYAVGGGRGQNGKELLATVERAPIRDDGTLGEWSVEPSIMNIPRRCVKLAVIGNTLYAFGGYGGILLDTIEQAAINPDGSLGEWLVSNDTMLVARYVHGRVKIANGIYNIGGHSKVGGAGISDVSWSKTDAEGFFLPWKKTAPLQTGRYALATATYNGYLYAIGGLTGATHLNTVERAKILEEGRLSNWEYTTPTPTVTGGAQAAVINGRIYLLGGGDGRAYLRDVFFAGFNKNGDIGYWGTAAEREQHRTARRLREQNRPPLPHQGIILQHFKQKLYSYLQVREDNGNVIWLAAPAKALQVGDRISYPNGTLMRNFYSKGLQRRFPFVLFISETRKLDQAR